MSPSGRPRGAKVGVRTHGTEGTYQWGCHCDECRQAHTEYAYERNRHYRGACGVACPVCNITPPESGSTLLQYDGSGGDE